ncbi:MAG: peptidase S41, partial [Gammaproteobacteria bacterium]|nr:S41 family peptidase [Gemmatimonadota bacterium]NIU75678.1 peptidase S41 [Gammaproteobacteria bacterium]NIX21643.1 peptidase S41 [Actinomycetota bacterium]
GTTDAELFDVLSDMVEALRDGHAELLSPFARYAWEGWREGRPENYSADLVTPYLGSPSGSASGRALVWATLDGGLGYLRISTFAPSTDLGPGVDRALESLGDVPGLIIDVRSNGGGSDTETEAVAGRLFDRRTHYRTYRYKAGPAHDDFGPEIRSYIEPAGRERYDGPVVVLQNRSTYSAAEDFVLAMRVRPNTTLVGDSTGGGAGNPIGRELPNGWYLRVSRWQAWAADGTWYEGLG